MTFSMSVVLGFNSFYRLVKNWERITIDPLRNLAPAACYNKTAKRIAVFLGGENGVYFTDKKFM